MQEREYLIRLYKSGLSQKDIANKTNLTYFQVRYRFQKYNILKRSWSEATYVKRNPKGDPFKIKKKLTIAEVELRGVGLGLYWGEGTRRSKNSVKLSNTDPRLIRKFIKFLLKICGINKNKLRFSLQIFSDIDSKKALNFWLKELKAKPNQFTKIVVTPSRGKGTYKNKIQHGVLTVNCHNKKLREIIEKMLLELK